MNKQQLQRKKQRVRSKVSGDSAMPRLAVYKSSKHLYAQVIDDTKHVTLVAASDGEIDGKKTKTERAFAVGEEIAKRAKAHKISQARFDRGGFLYHGRIKAVAEGARSAGLKI